MQIKRKTITKYATLKASATFYAKSSAHIFEDTVAYTVAAERHDFNGTSYPDITITLEGIGEVSLNPTEVYDLLKLIDRSRLARYVGREATMQLKSAGPDKPE